MATVIRHLGFCPVCGGDWKVQNGLLVHHGYRRPGTGEIYEDCFGAGRPPHELSPETAELYLKLAVIPERRQAERAVEHWGPPNEPANLPFDEWNRETRQHESVSRRREDVPRYEWERRLETVRHNALMRLDGLREEEKRLETLIATWEPLPIRPIEEFERQRHEAQAAQQARVTEDREQRSAHALVNLQQRVDRAVKKRDATELTELFSSGPQKVLDPLGRGTSLTREDALRLVDRDEVWAALGFMRGSDYIGWREVPDRYGMARRTDIEWPEPRQVPREAIAQVKAERAAKKEAKRQKEINAAVANARERLEQALRLRDTKAALSVFRRVEMPYEIAKTLRDRGRTEMLNLIGRDDVWSAFGWIHPDGSYYGDLDFEALLGPDDWKWDPRTQIPWPRDL